MAKFHPAPAIPPGYERELRRLDEGFSLSWDGWENVEGERYPHWVVMRKVKNSQIGLAKESGLFVPQERECMVKSCDWVDEDGKYLPLDQRLLDFLGDAQVKDFGPNGLAEYRRRRERERNRLMKEKDYQDREARGAALDEALTEVTRTHRACERGGRLEIDFKGA